MPESSRVGRWVKNIVDIAVIVLIVLAAKAAIAEPFYVPSGSMEPTLMIGDELLATKFPYGYSSASLPSFLVLPNTARILAALPERGDVVVFRWPGDRSQVWVKRVIGLPGDHVGMRNGQVWINGTPVGTSAGRHRPSGSRRRRRCISSALYRDIAQRTRTSNLQDGRSRRIRRHRGRFGASRPLVRHGRQPRQFRRQPCAAARRRRRTIAGRGFGRTRGRRRRFVGSRCQKPADKGLAVRFKAVAIFHRRALSLVTALHLKCSRACAGAA